MTGNGWDFPIDVAEARIRLPAAVRFGQRAVYTGAQGSTDPNAQVVEEKPGEIRFRTTRPLGPREGLTVAVAFPKGVVAAPDRAERDWLTDYGPLAVGAAGLLGLLGYFFIAWKRAGRDPRAGTVVPLFSPPDDLTPAAMRYVTQDGLRRPRLRRRPGRHGRPRPCPHGRGGRRLVLQRQDTARTRRIRSEPLPADEEAALRELAMTGETIVMEQKNHAKFSAAQKALGDVLKERYEGKLFHKNWGWAVRDTPPRRRALADRGCRRRGDRWRPDLADRRGLSECSLSRRSSSR